MNQAEFSYSPPLSPRTIPFPSADGSGKPSSPEPRVQHPLRGKNHPSSHPFNPLSTVPHERGAGLDDPPTRGRGEDDLPEPGSFSQSFLDTHQQRVGSGRHFSPLGKIPEEEPAVNACSTAACAADAPARMWSVSVIHPTQLDKPGLNTPAARLDELSQVNHIPKNASIGKVIGQALFSVVKFICRELLTLRLGFLKIQYPFSNHKLANAFIIGFRAVVSVGIFVGAIAAIAASGGTATIALSVALPFAIAAFALTCGLGWVFEALSYVRHNRQSKADQFRMQEFPEDDKHAALNALRSELTRLKLDRVNYESNAKASGFWTAARERLNFEQRLEELATALIEEQEKLAAEKKGKPLAYTQMHEYNPRDPSNPGAYVEAVTHLLNSQDSDRLRDSITGFTTSLSLYLNLAHDFGANEQVLLDQLHLQTLVKDFVANPKSTTKRLATLAENLGNFNKAAVEYLNRIIPVLNDELNEASNLGQFIPSINIFLANPHQTTKKLTQKAAAIASLKDSFKRSLEDLATSSTLNPSIANPDLAIVRSWASIPVGEVTEEYRALIHRFLKNPQAVNQEVQALLARIKAIPNLVHPPRIAHHSHAANTASAPPLHRVSH